MRPASESLEDDNNREYSKTRRTVLRESTITMRIMVTLAIFTFVGAPLLILGYLIKVKKEMHLIAGYSSEQIQDKDGLAHWVGSGTMLIGLLCIVTGILLSLFPQFALPVTVGFALVTMTSSIVMAIGCNRYTKQPDKQGR